MKHVDKKIMLISVFCGLIFWIVDACLDYVFFYSSYGSLLDILIFNIPTHEIYIRLTVLLLFIGIGLAFSHYITEMKASRTALDNILNNVIPICVTSADYDIISTNESYDRIFGSGKIQEKPVKCYDSRPGSQCRTEGCPVVQVLTKGKDLYTCESVKTEDDGGKLHFIVSATPYFDLDGDKVGIIETFQDITPRKELEKEKEQLITDLRQALEEVKVLSGFLPICASCKKIRDDKGYWTQIETYIRNHTEADFSHSICPDCAEKHYNKIK